MSSGVTLARVKEHVQAVEFDDDDALLAEYLAAAETHVAEYLRRDMATEYPGEWPGPCRVSVLMTVGHFYAQRSAVLVGAPSSELPLGVQALLAPYRSYS